MTLDNTDLCFFSQVLMKDIVTPVPQEEVKGVIRKCLEQAAQINYQRITDYARVEGDDLCRLYSFIIHSNHNVPLNSLT